VRSLHDYPTAICISSFFHQPKESGPEEVLITYAEDKGAIQPAILTRVLFLVPHHCPATLP